MNGPDDMWRPSRAVPFFRGLRNRLIATVALLVGGLCWVVVYLAFLAVHFPLYENLAVVLVSFLSVPTILVVMWISWGLSVGRRFRRALRDDWSP
jgi:hypothetical protein